MTQRSIVAAGGQGHAVYERQVMERAQLRPASATSSATRGELPLALSEDSSQMAAETQLELQKLP
jgi:hypothetical protein